MQIRQWLRIAKGWAIRQVRFTLEGNKGRSVLTAEKLYLTLSEGTYLALAAPRSLHITSQAVLMLNLQPARFMHCLMKNFDGNFAGEGRTAGKLFTFLKRTWPQELTWQCFDLFQELSSGVLWTFPFWIVTWLMWHQTILSCFTFFIIQHHVCSTTAVKEGFEMFLRR